MENGNQQAPLNGKAILSLPGDTLDRRVLDKVTIALEARLTEHISGVERRLAEMDAQIGLELQGVESQTAHRDRLLEEAIGAAEAQLRNQLEAARRESAEGISTLDQRLAALQQTLPAKFREIVEAMRESMEARLDLAATGIESRVAARALERHESEAGPMRQTVAQLETQLQTLREELPPKIREIVEALESAMGARIVASQQEASGHAAGMREVLEAELQRHSDAVDALDRKLAAFQQELPARFKAIVDAVQESLEARIAASNEAQLEQARQASSAAEARIVALERNLVRSAEEAADQAAERVWGAVKSRLQQHVDGAAPGGSGSMAELRQRSSHAEQTVLDLIAGIGDLFDKSPKSPRSPALQEKAPESSPEPEPAAPPAAAPEVFEETVVARFRPGDPPRKWRIPLISSLFVL